MKNSLTIKVVAQLSGVSAHRLRAWERRYNAFAPKRTASGRRIYSINDVERLKLMNQLLENGHNIGSVANLSKGELLALANKTTLKSQTIAGVARPPTSSRNSSTAAILKALNGFNFEQINHELSQARLNFTVKQLIFEILSPLLAQVGVDVGAGKMGIAEEHLLSMIIRDHIIEIMQSIRHPQENGSMNFVLTTPEGDMHEFGILLAAVLCLAHGMNVKYLGPNLPPRELARAASRVAASVVIIGSTSPSPDYVRQPLPDYVKQVLKGLPKSTEVWVGGMQAQTTMRRGNARQRRIRIMDSLVGLDAALAALKA